jgi:uncharacterized protein YccT (UPF0319 family)
VKNYRSRSWIIAGFFASLFSVNMSIAQTLAEQVVVIEPIVVDGRAIASGASVAQIVGLRKNGDGYVSVRVAPTVKSKERDRLTQDRYVLILNGNKNAEKLGFFGVIYADKNEDVDLENHCEIENPINPAKTSKQIYTGPCRSGWVAKRFVEILAD